MLKKILQTKYSSIASAAVIIGAAGLVSRILGIVRDRVLASQFGAGDDLDIYYAAFRIPDLLLNLIIFGALSSAFIPIFISLIKKEESAKYNDNKGAWDLANNLLNVLTIGLIAIGLVLVVLSPWLVPLITPGYSGDKLDTTVKMTQLIFLSPLLLGISGIFGGILQSFRRFLAFSLAPIMYNLGIIFGAVFLTGRFGVYGLAFGVIIGCMLHLLVQLPVAIRLGFKFKAIFRLKEQNFIKIIKLMGPRVLGLASSQINFIVITIFASFLAAGSLTIFNFANNLQGVAIGLIGVSFAIAAFPALSKSFSNKKETEFNETLMKTFRQIVFFIIPFSIVFIVLRVQIVRVILGAGKFNWEDTILTANSLGLFCFSLFAQALIPLLVRVFYARQNTLMPFIASLVSVIVNIFLTWYLIAQMEVLGLALGFSISAIINFILLIVFVKIKIKALRFEGVLRSLFEISIASFVMGVVIQYTKAGLGNLVDMSRFWGILAQGLIAGLMGIAVFVIIMSLLKNEEYTNFVQAFRRKFFKMFKVKGEGMRESGGN
jgi:putative peptidoglycan lipid II flippase